MVVAIIVILAPAKELLCDVVEEWMWNILLKWQFKFQRSARSLRTSTR